MRLIYLYKLLKVRNVLFKPILFKATYYKSSISNLSHARKRFITSNVSLQAKFLQDDEHAGNEIDAEFDLVDDYKYEIDQGYSKDLLYKNTTDALTLRIYNCASVQEWFNVFENNKNQLTCEHLVISVLVLYDLKKMFDEINRQNEKFTNDFIVQLRRHEHFQNLINLIEKRVNFFSSEELGYLLLYLKKLETNSEIIREKLESVLVSNFKISDAVKFVETSFDVHNLKSYFETQNLVPYIFALLNDPNLLSLEDFSDLTVCLNKLHNIVPADVMSKYLTKLDCFIENKTITSKDYKIVLKIISFLNYPKWRYENTVAICKCILLLKNNLNLLNIQELLILYEIFFKIQEPGSILNELQRCSSKFLQEFEETITSKKILLFSSLIFFSSPSLRKHFQLLIQNYVYKCENFDDLLNLRKLLSFLKISDAKLCHYYWNKILEFYKSDPDSVNVLQLVQNYYNFNIDIDHYRHIAFESEMMKRLDHLARDDFAFYPQKLAQILPFALLYGSNMKLIEYLVKKLENNWEQYNHIDCLKLSLSLRLFNEIKTNSRDYYKKAQYASRIDKVLDKVIRKEYLTTQQHIWKNNVLVKTCVYKTNVDMKILDDLMLNYKNYNNLSSKHLENMSYGLLSTNSLIPELVDKATNYVTQYKENILGFNVEKILYLCYWLGYQPNNAELFFKNATDIIIRDQERMGGLSMIHCALALCFFNRLPNSLIKSIFNVEFLDKLDTELQNCYSRDKYPQRVRHNLMQLNRAVCLDYPESNVPWFHEKFIQEMNNKSDGAKRSKLFNARVKNYLNKTIKKPEAMLENVQTPYGYNVDFVVNLNEIEDAQSSSTHKRLAILLMPQYAYTRHLIQLRGRYQMKNRHLEILGYKVVMIDFSDWITLFYDQDRIEFLSNLIWPKRLNNYNEVTAR